MPVALLFKVSSPSTMESWGIKGSMEWMCSICVFMTGRGPLHREDTSSKPQPEPDLVFGSKYELSRGGLLSAQREKVLSVMIGDPGGDRVKEKVSMLDSEGGLLNDSSGGSILTGSVCAESGITIPWRVLLPFADFFVVECSLLALALSFARLYTILKMYASYKHGHCTDSGTTPVT